MKEIKINKVEEPTCSLYDPDSNHIGEINSTLELNDVRIQIKNNGVSGYYIMWKGSPIRIDRRGNLEAWPKGFYDIIDDQLMELLDWEK
jgi:predicted ATPase